MKKRIEDAIRLLLGNMGEDWFIILEEPKTEKFVQFAYDEKDGLLFDLPLQCLNKNEVKRAEEVLKKYDIELETATCLDKPGGSKCGEQHSFSAVVGRDAKMATELVYAVFTRVYNFGDDVCFNISIDR